MNSFGFNRYAAKYLTKVKEFGAAGYILHDINQAIENFANDFKYKVFNGIRVAAWPFYGGNAVTHSFDLYSNDTISWGGTLTHNSAGVTGSAGYGQTPVNPARWLSNPNNYTIGYYSRNNVIGDNMYDIYTSSSGVYIALSPRSTGGIWTAFIGSTAQTNVTNTFNNTAGLIYVVRYNASQAYSAFNTTAMTTDTVTSGGAPNSVLLFLIWPGLGYSTRNISFGFVADGSTGSTIADGTLYNLILNFQTALGR